MNPIQPVSENHAMKLARRALSILESYSEPGDILSQVRVILRSFIGNGIVFVDDVAPSEGEGWQPIESAPKDGRKILICELLSGIILKYTEHEGKEFPHVCTAYWWKGDSLNAPGWAGNVMGTPTHWMPLPDPPKAYTIK